MGRKKIPNPIRLNFLIPSEKEKEVRYFIKNIQKDSFDKEIKKASNDSWIRIESKSDLPKEGDFRFNNTFVVYYYCENYCNSVFKGSIDPYTLEFRDIENNLVKEKVTHYQPYVIPDNPKN